MRRKNRHDNEAANSFEQVYPGYEFSELVRCGVALAKLLATLQFRRARPRQVQGKSRLNPSGPAHPRRSTGRGAKRRSADVQISSVVPKRPSRGSVNKRERRRKREKPGVQASRRGLLANIRQTDSSNSNTGEP